MTSPDRTPIRRLLLSIVCLVAGGCQPSGRPDTGLEQRQPRPAFHVAAVGNPLTFNPIAATDPAARAVGGALFDTLVRVDAATARAIPHLAEQWTIDESGTTYTLHLRDDVEWHDGNPLRAEDVVFTVAAIHATTDSPYHHLLRIDGHPIIAEKTGARSVRFVLPRRHAPFLASLVIPILPSHVLGVDSDSNESRQWDASTDVRTIVGTGPYRMSEYRSSDRVILERNPKYWRLAENGQRLPRLDRYVVLIASQREVALQWFVDGRVHIFHPRFDETPGLTQQRRAGLRVDPIGPDTSSLFLTFNRNPLHYRRNGEVDPRLQWFRDPAFNQAIAHAIDKRAIIDRALDGRGIPAVSYLSPANWFYHSELTDYVFDPALARRILEDSQYIDRDGDGVREDAGGQRLAFTLCTNEGNPVRERIAKLVIEGLADIGMEVTLERLSFPTLFERLDATYAWDAMLIGFTGGIDPVSSDNLLRSSGELHVWHPSQQLPASAWEAQIDDLLDQGLRELDPDRRREIYWHVQEILHKQLPMIHLVRPTLFAARRDSVLHFAPTPWGFQSIEELDLQLPERARQAKARRRR